jgi:hypothetical protein
MGPVTTKFAKIDPGPSQTFGTAGALLALLGTVLVAVALTAANWFNDSHTRPSNFRATFDALESAAAQPAKAYFTWLGWVLLAAALLAALIAVVPTIGTAFRVIAPLLAVAAIVLTFLAIKLTRSVDIAGFPTYGDYLKHARLGFYLAVVGFALIGAGGAIGPRRKAD